MSDPPGDAVGAGNWLRSARDRLEAAGVETASLDARMLLLDGLSLPHGVIVAEPNLALDRDEIGRLESLLARRLSREPVSRILGRREFYGRRFEIDAHVLDPRPDTETLVDAALREIDRRFGDAHPCRFLDLGTGSGCIAVTLLAERSGWRAVAADVDASALEVARRNAIAHNVSDRLKMVETDWFSGLSGTFDLVVSNPPYIADREIADLTPEVRDHDPRAALQGGADGLDAYREILGSVGDFLNPRGSLALEVGERQADSVRALALETGAARSDLAVRKIRDLAGYDRVVIVRSDAGEIGKREVFGKNSRRKKTLGMSVAKE